MGHTTGYEYDPAGNMVKINDRDGYTTTLNYDLNNQLTGIQYADGRQVSLNYNPQGHVTGMTDWLGTNTIELDPLGRIKKVTDFAGRVQQFTWTATGQKESITYPDDSKVTYQHDQLDRLTGVTDAFNRTTTYRYNPAGKLVQTLLPNGSETLRDYDNLYRIISLTHKDPGGKTTDSYQYEYDPAGNKTSIKKGNTDEDELEEDEAKTYSYDALNQLVKVSEINGESSNYYYDTLGNRVAMIDQDQSKGEAKYYQYDQLNRLTGIYDHGGDLKELSYDNRGNLTEIRSGGKVFNNYTFDAANRLTEAVNKFGDKTTYTYDGLGHRIQVITDLNHGAEHNNRPEFPPGPGGPPEFVQELKNKNPGPPSHAGNPKPGWDHQFNRYYMIQHNVVDFTEPYDNLLMSYGEHSQIQRYTYGKDLTSMDFIALDDHDNGWIPSGTETAYVDNWDTLYYQHDDLGTVDKVIGSSGKTSAHYNNDEFGRPLGAVKLDPKYNDTAGTVPGTANWYLHVRDDWSESNIKQLQRDLNAWGYRDYLGRPLAVDGDYRLKTFSAQLQFFAVERGSSESKALFMDLVTATGRLVDKQGIERSGWGPKSNPDWDYYHFLNDIGLQNEIPKSVLPEVIGSKRSLTDKLAEKWADRYNNAKTGYQLKFYEAGMDPVISGQVCDIKSSAAQLP